MQPHTTYALTDSRGVQLHIEEVRDEPLCGNLTAWWVRWVTQGCIKPHRLT
jgi:hypothetical protein